MVVVGPRTEVEVLEVVEWREGVVGSKSHMVLVGTVAVVA